MRIDELLVADEPAAWTAAGFTVSDDCVIAGSVRIRLVGRSAGHGILDWTLTDDEPDIQPATHPNGSLFIDHLVLLSPNLARSVAELAAMGLSPRGERDGDFAGSPMRQIFFRMGEVILEVVGSPDAENDGPWTFWGLTFAVEDIDATASFFGSHVGQVKDAVQPGRRICTLRHRDLDLSVATAFMSKKD